MNPMTKEEGVLFPITVDGVKETYISNAPLTKIMRNFLDSDSIAEFEEYMKEDGFRIEKYKMSLELNFDDK